MCFGFCQSQTIKTLNKIKTDHQSCLDKGDYMLGCSLDYYKKTDSLLNVVYNKIRLKLNTTEKRKFKNEQLGWLKKKDSYFRKVEKNTKNEVGDIIGSDLRMIITDKEADFVFDRVEELIKRL
ncbi:hypothetical protein GS03_00445 [Flavobacterium sangjuense]|uniref:Lysozyme inhibitor LprI-like N-terminal domain-containing protein n=1 Tax=Flavobacterium sangjuense TaxID=2518177 RepID=A0A4P7PRY0_9FLAO|nr:hypothetical protein GS03_00445 [Flavobacterium sangjuense]